MCDQDKSAEEPKKEAPEEGTPPVKTESVIEAPASSEETPAEPVPSEETPPAESEQQPPPGQEPSSPGPDF